MSLSHLMLYTPHLSILFFFFFPVITGFFFFFSSWVSGRNVVRWFTCTRIDPQAGVWDGIPLPLSSPEFLHLFILKWSSFKHEFLCIQFLCNYCKQEDLGPNKLMVEWCWHHDLTYMSRDRSLGPQKLKVSHPTTSPRKRGLPGPPSM